jgi:hypothetical protein
VDPDDAPGSLVEDAEHDVSAHASATATRRRPDERQKMSEGVLRTWCMRFSLD